MALRPRAARRANWRTAAAGELADGLEGGVGLRGAGDGGGGGPPGGGGGGGGETPPSPQGPPGEELSAEDSAGVRCVEQSDGRVRSVRVLLWEGASRAGRGQESVHIGAPEDPGVWR